MLKYDDCGLRNIWLKNGYRYEAIKGHGKCMEIADINGLHRTIAHHLVNYRKRLSGAEIRFLRVEMGLSQNRLADCMGVDEQTISLWERSKRRPTMAAERMLRLLYLEHADGKTKVAVPWMGKQTEPGLVIYLAAESPASVRSRIQAYQRHHGVRVPNFAIVQSPIDMFDGDADTDKLIQLVKQIEWQKGQPARLIHLQGDAAKSQSSATYPPRATA